MKTIPILLCACSCFGQTRFASVTITPLDEIKALDQVHAGLKPRAVSGQVAWPSISMHHLLLEAFVVNSTQISIADPSVNILWTNHARYSLTATLPKGASVMAIPAMLQTMLTEKFGLAFHKVTATTGVLSLTLEPSARGVIRTLLPIGAATLDKRDGIAKEAQKKQPVTIVMSPKTYMLPDGTMGAPMDHTVTISLTDTPAGLAAVLSKRLRMPVIDNTGVSKIYTFMFPVRFPSGIPDPTGDIDIADMPMRRQLLWYQQIMRNIGFELTPTQSMMQQIVIDHLDKVPK